MLEAIEDLKWRPEFVDVVLNDSPKARIGIHVPRCKNILPRIAPLVPV